MSFHKILCPTDFSAGSRQALRTAVQLANTHAAELVVLHAWYIPPSMYAGEYVFPPAVLGEMSDDAKRGVDEIVREATALGAKRVTGSFVSGVAWEQIVEVLDHQGFDLCVMGTHGRTGLERILLGSVAEKVVRHAPCSVLAVRPGAEPKPFTHIMCPTDFSGAAEHALDLATGLVAANGRLTLLHVIEVPVMYAGQVRAADYARHLDVASATALEKAAARAKTQTSATVTTLSRIGYAGAQTLAALEADPSVDLVVMGSHGRTGLERVILGSVAEKVVRHAPCPVLVARRR